MSLSFHGHKHLWRFLLRNQIPQVYGQRYWCKVLSCGPTKLNLNTPSKFFWIHLARKIIPTLAAESTGKLWNSDSQDPTPIPHPRGLHSEFLRMGRHPYWSYCAAHLRMTALGHRSIKCQSPISLQPPETHPKHNKVRLIHSLQWRRLYATRTVVSN